MRLSRFILKPWNPVFLLSVLLAGCGREQIQVYGVPKEKPPMDAAAQKPVNWTTPAAWQEHPGEGMRLASFTVADKAGRPAEVTIVPMGGIAGTTAGNVNRWRGQLNLDPLGEQEISKQLASVDVGPAQGQLYDEASTELVLENKSKARILAAILTRGDTTYFFKMTGADSLVEEQKPAFLQFLKSITFQEANDVTEPSVAQAIPTAPDAASNDASLQSAHAGVPATAPDAADHPDWQVPSNWQLAPASPMLVVKYILPGNDGARADINVSSSKGAGGGIAANVNRWCGQLGLTPVEDQAGLDKLVSSLDVLGGRASVVDMTGTNETTGKPARLVAIIVPRDGETWFYKLMGDAGLVEKEKSAFVHFVQTVKYQNAP